MHASSTREDGRDGKNFESGCDRPLWHFHPSWYVNKLIAISRVSYILKYGAFMQALKKSVLDKPVENTFFEVDTVLPHTRASVPVRTFWAVHST